MPSAFPMQTATDALSSPRKRDQRSPDREPNSGDRTNRPRDAALRTHYAHSALSLLPRLLTSIDRCPYRATYGCFDRQFWHYRTADFPSEMYQEGALPLALAYTLEMPGNRWQGQDRLRELSVAALHFAAKSSHRDGSCDDYYPFERALGAAVFSLVAATETYQLLQLEDDTILSWFQRRGDWLARHDETGRLANHQALAALALARTARITGQERFERAAQERIARVLDWQSDEGWFDEYGGADPGYQTVTLWALASYQELTGADGLEDAIARGLAFARCWLHPDDSYAGEYGSRGTYHCYPHGMELLAPRYAAAGELADAFLRALAGGKTACFDDDRLVAHRLGNLMEAYRDWSPTTADRDEPCPGVPSEVRCGTWSLRNFPEAQLLTASAGRRQTFVSAARGGVFKHFVHGTLATNDAGLILETSDGRVAVSQRHDRSSSVTLVDGKLQVRRTLSWMKFETATPTKLIVFRTLLVTAGRWCRSLVRWLLQRRLITGKHAAPIAWVRTFEFRGEGPGEERLQVTDSIELQSSAITVKRMSLGSDHQSVYVAATGVYQDAVLSPWQDLGEHVDELNRRRHATIVRQL